MEFLNYTLGVDRAIHSVSRIANTLILCFPLSVFLADFSCIFVCTNGACSLKIGFFYRIARDFNQPAGSRRCGTDQIRSLVNSRDDFDFGIHSLFGIASAAKLDNGSG